MNDVAHGAHDRETIRIPTRATLRWLGALAFLLGVLGVAPAVGLMAAGDDRFSFATTFLSELGASGDPWVRTAFNSSLLVLAPVRLGLLLVIAGVLGRAGARRATKVAIVTAALVVTIGGVGVPAIPYSLSPTVHNAFATAYYGGWAGLGSTLGVTAFRRRLPLAWSLADAAVVLTTVVFLALGIAGYRAGTPGPEWPAVIAEWCSYLALLAWVTAHALRVELPRTDR